MKSDYHDWRGSGYTEDRLDKPGWLEQWLTMHNLPYPGVPSAEELDDLKRLREHMLQKLAARESVNSDDLEGLNRAMSGRPMFLRIEESDSVIAWNPLLYEPAGPSSERRRPLPSGAGRFRAHQKAAVTGR